MRPVASSAPMSAGLLASLAAVAISTYLALTIDLFGWDVDITRKVQEFDVEPAGFLRDGLFWMGLRGVAGVLLALSVGLFWWKAHRLEAVFLASVAVLDGVNFLLRAIVARPRPSIDLVDVAGGPQGASFPSGTALHVFLFYGLLIFLVTPYISSRRLKYALWLIAAIYIPATGIWLIYDGRHWFTDVMGGYIYGTFYLLALITAFSATRSWIADGSALRSSDRLPGLLRTPAQYALRLVS